MKIKTVYLVFKTHLDLGYTDLADVIVANYKERHIPASLELARQLRERGGEERFVWTTGSWMINECLEHGDPQTVALVEEGIRQGDLCWLGVPFTTHTELIDPSLYRYALSISKRLDESFGRKTIAAKMTDVPGHTCGVVPLLAEAGIRFMHIGVNPGSKCPEVPDIFRWRSPCGSELLMMYHKKEYGETTVIPGLDFGISIAHTSDNCGPQSMEKILKIYDDLRKQFPGAEIRACSLSDFAERLVEHSEMFPVVDDEIGDTWIHGPGSAPGRVARHRALSRLRRDWQQQGLFDDSTDAQRSFSDNLLCVAEHTWGLGHGQMVEDSCYSKDALAHLRTTDKCRRLESSWKEQDAYIDKAVAALPANGLKEEALACLDELTPREPSTDGYTAVAAGELIEGDGFALGVDPDTGAIAHFLQKEKGFEWCRNGHFIGRFMYEVFSQETCETYLEQHIKYWPRVAWLVPVLSVRPDFDRQGLIKDQQWCADSVEVWRKERADGLDLLIQLTMPDEAVKGFGCPARVAIEWSIGDGGKVMDCTLQWFDREASRLPDAIWFTFSPKAIVNDGWRFEKMGQEISPFKVVANGNRRLHAIGDEVRYRGQEGQFTIKAIDSPIVAPGKPLLYDFTGRQPTMHYGVSFNLWNNMWNTNFTYWSEEDALFRYKLSIEASDEHAMPDFDDWG